MLQALKKQEFTDQQKMKAWDNFNKSSIADKLYLRMRDE